MKKLFAFLLPLIILLIFANLYISIRHKPMLNDVCVYQYSLDLIGQESESVTIDKWQFSTCLYRESFKKLFKLNKYCDQIPRPACQLGPNDTSLCEGMIQHKMTQDSQADCELSFACPELLADYQEILKQCRSK